MSADDPRRLKIVSFARSQTTLGVDSSASEDPDTTGRRPRKGWQRLLAYLDLAAPADANTYDVFHYSDRSGLSDWCGIFALWAIKSAGLAVGTWRWGQGIGSVPGIEPVKPPNQPQPGDIGFREWVDGRHVQHMDLVASVGTDGSISTIDGNDSGKITGPSGAKARNLFDSFFTAFNSKTPTPVGRWEVHVGVWTWNYIFHADQTAEWTDIKQPNLIQGSGTWRLDNLLRIQWQTGTQEEWDLPLNPGSQTGTLLGQGRIITATRLSTKQA